MVEKKKEEGKYVRDALVSSPKQGKEDEKKLYDLYQTEVWDLELTEAEQQRLLRIISGMVESYVTSNKSFYDDIYRWDDQYEGILPPKDFPWEGCANYHDPITEMNVNAIYARIIKRFRTLDYLRVKQYQQTKEKSLLTQKYLRWLFEKRLQWTELMMTTGREPIKHGSGVYCLTWEMCEKTKKVVVPQKKQVKAGVDLDGTQLYDEQVEYVVKEETKLIQRPKVDFVSLLDYMRSDETDRFVAPMWEARRLWKSAVEFYTSAEENGYDKKSVDEILKKMEEGKSDVDKSLDNLPEREIIEWWGWIRVKDDPLAKPERIVFVYDRGAKKYLHCQRFPYLFDESNFTVLNFERRAYDWRGRGICQKLEHVNREADKLHDIYLDSSAMVTAKAFKKKKGADTNYLLEPFYPGVVWEVQKMDDINVLDVGVTPTSPLAELEQLDMKAAKQTGIGAYQTGQESGAISQPTASGQLSIIQEGNVTLDESAKEWSSATIRVARQVLSMLKQFRPEDEYLMVMEEADRDELLKTEVTVDSLIDDPEMIVVDRSIMEEQENKNKAIELYQIAIKDPVLNSNAKFYQHVLSNVLSAYKTMDADLILPTVEEIQESLDRIAKTAEIQNMQLELQKLQTQTQLAQMNAQVKQQQIAATQQVQNEQIAAKERIAAADRQAAGEQAAEEQNLEIVRDVMSGTEEAGATPPAEGV
jgi:hypothetical protein